MTVVVGGSSPQITFADSTVQNTAFTGTASATSPYTTALGYQAGLAVPTGTPNTFVGYQAGKAVTSGSDNIAIGQALATNTTGNSNIAIGDGALNSTTGSSNTAIGPGAGYSISSGSNNVVIGGYSGSSGPISATGSNYVVFSDGAGNVKGYFDGTGNLIGSARVTGTSLNITNSSTLQVLSFTYGSTQEWAMFNNTTGSVNNLVIQNSAGSSGVQLATQSATAWSAYSDPKLKNITGTYTNPLSDISEIKPIKFTWKSDSTNRPCVGVDATTVETVVPEAVDLVSFSQTDETKYLSVRYTELIPLCIASIQALNTLVTAQATEIETLKAKVGA